MELAQMPINDRVNNKNVERVKNKILESHIKE